MTLNSNAHLQGDATFLRLVSTPGPACRLLTPLPKSQVQYWTVPDPWWAPLKVPHLKPSLAWQQTTDNFCVHTICQSFTTCLRDSISFDCFRDWHERWHEKPHHRQAVWHPSFHPVVLSQRRTRWSWHDVSLTVVLAVLYHLWCSKCVWTDHWSLAPAVNSNRPV